ncbi:MAG: adenosine kinase [Bacteroidales bacterium]|nr:adenosine kinase [Bacteroidales bacterium]
MAKILALGNALVDVLIRLKDDDLLNQFNLPKGSMQLVDLNTAKKIEDATNHLNRKISSGGSAANTINGLANLGVNTGFIGKIGEDEFGKYFEEGMKKNNIIPFLFKSKTPTGRAMTLISQDGERTFGTYLGAAIEQIPDEIEENYFTGYDYFHVEGYIVQNHDLLEKAYKLAKENKLITSIDLASYNVVEQNLDFLKKIIEQYVDIVFANEDEAKSFTGNEPMEAINQLSKLCDVTIVKLGSKGSIIKHKNELIQINAIKANCIDTTGAGDLYASGFLYGLLKGFDLKKCGEIGSLTASKVIENIGAHITDQQWRVIRKEI